MSYNYGNKKITLIKPSKHVEVSGTNIFKKMSYNERFGKKKREII